MEDLRLLEGRGIRRLFGWGSIPDPTTFGRFLRRGGLRLAEQLDTLLWQAVRARWAEVHFMQCSCGDPSPRPGNIIPRWVATKVEISI